MKILTDRGEIASVEGELPLGYDPAMGKVLPLVVSVLAGGCSLLLPIDEAPSQAPADAGQALPTDSGKTMDDGGPFVNGDAGSADAALPTPQGLAIDLTDPTRVIVEQPGRFRLYFAAAKGWQLSAWADLATAPNRIFQGRDEWGTFVPRIATWANGSCANNTTVNANINPAFVSKANIVLRTEYRCDPGGGKPLLFIGTDYAIWPSGEVAILSSARSLDGPQADVLTGYEHSHLNVPGDALWDYATDLRAEGGAFRLRGSATSIGIINHYPADAPARTAPTNRFFSVMPRPQRLVESSDLRSVDLLVGPLSLTSDLVTARATERGNPTPVTNVEGYYERELGAFYLTRAAPGALAFDLPGNIVRFEPAFYVENWTEPTYEVKQDGVVVASDRTPITTTCVSSYAAPQKRLVFQLQTQVPRKAIATRFEISP